MHKVSTKTHGMLDYLSVPALLALPRLLDWSPAVTRLLTVSALGTLVYSLLTRYELGLKPILSMPAHLKLDAASGTLLLASPFLLGERNRAVVVSLMGLGLFEIGAALATETEPAGIGPALTEPEMLDYSV